MTQDSKLNRSKNHDQSDTADTGPSLGNFLQRERLKKQFTLEEVAEKTCIHITTLKAIENNDRAKMPAEVFARGFIKLYADFLGLDKQDVLERYDRERGNIDEDGTHSNDLLSSEKMAESTSYLGKFFLLFILLALIGLGYYFYQSSQEPANTTSFSFGPETDIKTEELNEEIDVSELTTNPVPHEVEIESTPMVEEQNFTEEAMLEDADPPLVEEGLPAVQEEDPASTLIEEPQIPSTISNQAADEKIKTEAEEEIRDLRNVTDNPVENVSLAPAMTQDQEAQKKIHLRILFTERTWIQISVDNNPPKDFLFDPEEERSWQASEKLKLFLGNSGGARLFVDDEEIPITGVSGSPLRITIPDDLAKYGM
ncbi:MAG: DUF4115 domain-containing protein [Desulfobulbaceae bacterium]|nr:DUF4115 domain-containing protein [Desulfobulbaceae bacterium]